MVRKSASRPVLVAALVAAFATGLAACSSEAPTEAPAAAADEQTVLKERQDNFEAIGDAFKAVRGELEKDTPDFTLIATKAGDINTRAQLIKDHFPAGTSVADGYDTEALATIWEKPEEFSAAAQKLVDESAKLMTIAAEGDKAATGAQAMTMGGTCKGCHDNFRLDDKK